MWSLYLSLKLLGVAEWLGVLLRHYVRIKKLNKRYIVYINAN